MPSQAIHVGFANSAATRKFSTKPRQCQPGKASDELTTLHRVTDLLGPASPPGLGRCHSAPQLGYINTETTSVMLLPERREKPPFTFPA